MRSPRFVVSSVTGLVINPKAQQSSNGKVAQVAYSVIDTWYAFRLLREFNPGAGRGRDTRSCHARALTLCAELNAAHEAWLNEATDEASAA